MGDERQLRRSAEALIGAHGGAAAEICSQKALLWHGRGDQDATKVWIRLMQAVQRLESERNTRSQATEAPVDDSAEDALPG